MTTGRRSERFFQERYASAPDICLVQAADFYALSLRAAAERGFGCVVWAVFFGKLVKQAQGFESTHAREAELDFALLARWAGEAGADEAACAAILGANTAAQVLALLSGDSAGGVPGNVAGRLTALLVGRAKAAAARHLDGHLQGQTSAALDVRYVVFGLDGGCLYADDIPPALFSPAPPLHLGRASR